MSSMRKKKNPNGLLAKRVSNGINYFTKSIKFCSLAEVADSDGTPQHRGRRRDSVDSVLLDAEKVIDGAALKGVTSKHIKGAKALRKRVAIARNRYMQQQNTTA